LRKTYLNEMGVSEASETITRSLEIEDIGRNH